MKLPPGYERSTTDTAHAFVLSGALPWLEAALLESPTIYDWARGRTEEGQLFGRGPVHVVRAPTLLAGASSAWVVRHYRRGGAMAPLLGDRYVRSGESRPVRELRASVTARARGIRTPTVVAGAAYPRGVTYRADLVTALVEGVTSLAQAFLRASGADASQALASAGRLVKSLEDARVVHTDLNAHNVLVGTHEGALPAHVIDLDRCRVLPLAARPPRRSMRGRLERSLRRLAGERGRPMAAAELDAYRGGLEERG